MATEDKAAPYPWEGCDTGTWMWHIHHCRLLEMLTEPASVRAQFIRDNKLEREIEIRLQRMRPVQDVDRIPQAVRETGIAYGESAKALSEAGKACDVAADAYLPVEETYNKAGRMDDKTYGELMATDEWKACERAREVNAKAWDTCGKVWQPHLDALQTHRAEIKALHAEECPGCPWDGETLFPDKGDAYGIRSLLLLPGRESEKA